MFIPTMNKKLFDRQLAPICLVENIRSVPQNNNIIITLYGSTTFRNISHSFIHNSPSFVLYIHKIKVIKSIQFPIYLSFVIIITTNHVQCVQYIINRLLCRTLTTKILFDNFETKGSIRKVRGNDCLYARRSRPDVSNIGLQTAELHCQFIRIAYVP